MLYDMQHTQKTAGQTATITLVIMRDCHVRNNRSIDIEPSKLETYRRLAAKRGWLMGVRKGGAL